MDVRCEVPGVAGSGIVETPEVWGHGGKGGEKAFGLECFNRGGAKVSRRKRRNSCTDALSV